MNAGDDNYRADLIPFNPNSKTRLTNLSSIQRIHIVVISNGRISCESITFDTLTKCTRRYHSAQLIIFVSIFVTADFYLACNTELFFMLTKMIGTKLITNFIGFFFNDEHMWRSFWISKRWNIFWNHLRSVEF